MSNELKKSIIKLLEEDKEFRYEVAGLLGINRLDKIEEALVRLTDTITVLKDIQAKSEARLTKIEERLEEHDRKFNEILAEIARLREEQNKLREDMKDEFAKVWQEITRLREDMNKGFTKVWDEFAKLRKEMGILSDRFGVTLEDIVVTKLPLLLQKEGIIINREDIKARYLIPINGKKVEVDIYVEGRINGRNVKIIGEVKSRIDKSDVNRFYNRFRRYDAYKFIFGHTIRPDAEVKAKELGIRLYATYSY